MLTRVGAAISEYEHVYQRGGLRSVGHVERACVLARSTLPAASLPLSSLSLSPSVPVPSIAFTLSLCRAPRFPPPSSVRLPRGGSNPSSSAVLVRLAATLLLSVRFTFNSILVRPLLACLHTLSRARSFVPLSARRTRRRVNTSAKRALHPAKSHGPRSLGPTRRQADTQA